MTAFSPGTFTNAFNAPPTYRGRARVPGTFTIHVYKPGTEPMTPTHGSMIHLRYPPTSEQTYRQQQIDALHHYARATMGTPEDTPPLTPPTTSLTLTHAIRDEMKYLAEVAWERTHNTDEWLDYVFYIRRHLPANIRTNVLATTDRRAGITPMRVRRVYGYARSHATPQTTNNHIAYPHACNTWSTSTEAQAVPIPYASLEDHRHCQRPNNSWQRPDTSHPITPQKITNM